MGRRHFSSATARFITCYRNILHHHNTLPEIFSSMDPSTSKPTSDLPPQPHHGSIILFDNNNNHHPDYISDLPDEVLSCIFHFLPNAADRKTCSLVCKRWLIVEGQSRHRLVLDARQELSSRVQTIFSRFDSVTKLVLRCDRRSVSIVDDALILISLRCKNLTRLKLRGCRELTDVGLAAFAMNTNCLKKFSSGSCLFGVKGMNAVLQHCKNLEELSIKRHHGVLEPIGPGVASLSLKTICFREIYNGHCFDPLITGAKNLKTLKIIRCIGDWDRVFQTISTRENSLVQIHLERIQLTDMGLEAISNCKFVDTLHLVKTPECTDDGLTSIAENCKLLRKLHIDGWRTNRIGGHLGLISVANHCINLQELVLISVNPSLSSLEAIFTNCRKLERLALCGSDSIGDKEISCIADKCLALKKLCIKGCPITDKGIETFAWGCPNLVKIKVKKCRGVTVKVVDKLRIRRGRLVVNMDVAEIEPEAVIEDASVAVDDDAGSSSRNGHGHGQASVFNPRYGLLACTFRRWSIGRSNDGL
ncbi:F-box protein SKIP2-like [Impatiens glandulifera]|uniref:F-box protein SKIP2-like n=1 Tax=Impatiens glandulifera TaxID=253017 RepID=UPI001FB19C26|nr:F-box protein SKIP2-like [Impatiens glandulifera]